MPYIQLRPKRSSVLLADTQLIFQITHYIHDAWAKITFDEAQALKH